MYEKWGSRAEYLREWKRKNPNKVKAYNDKYSLSPKGQAAQKRSIEKQRGKRKDYFKGYYRKYKIETLTHYGNGKCACVKCGFEDIRALSIDHINGGGNRDRRSRSSDGRYFYKRLKNDGYPEGYQTLCMNCQFIKREINEEVGHA